MFSEIDMFLNYKPNKAILFQQTCFNHHMKNNTCIPILLCLWLAYISHNNVGKMQFYTLTQI